MKPFAKGWEKLSPLERLVYWFDQNKPKLKGQIREYRRLMENFSSSCKDPKNADYFAFLEDIQIYPPAHQEVLAQGFFAMYNLSPALLDLKSTRIFDPEEN